MAKSSNVQEFNAIFLLLGCRMLAEDKSTGSAWSSGSEGTTESTTEETADHTNMYFVFETGFPFNTSTHWASVSLR